MAHVDHIDARNEGNAHGHGLAAIGMVNTRRRNRQPARKSGDIAQTRRGPDAGRGDNHVAEFVEIFKFARRVQANGFAAGNDLPGVGDAVYPPQQS
ncbi:hypothetical protein D3C72_813570 [compost metagenome]